MNSKKFNISHSFKTKSEITTRTILIADAFGLGIDEEKEFPIYDNFKFELYANDIVYITGDSGSGKSWILNNVFSKSAHAICIDDIKIDDEEILIEGVGKDLNDALRILNLAGLGDAFLYLRKYSQLSDGQKYRYKIAKFIESDKHIWILDEFGAKLDRITAKIVAYNLQKIARQLGRLVVCATTHTDLKNALQPSLYIEKGFETDVHCERLHEPDEEIKFKLKDIYDEITIEKGERKDYDKLKRFHYRQSGVGAVRDICTMKHEGNIIGVMILTYPHLALKGRNVHTNKKFAKMTTETCKMINEQFSCISRIVIHPKYRGLGLSYHMIKFYLDNFADTKYVETLAVMSKYSPFFKKAGMTLVEVEADKRRAKKVQQIEEYGFNTSLVSSAIYNKSIYDKLTSERQQEFRELIISILKSYKGAIRKLFGDKKSLEEVVADNLFTVIKEIKRADTLYWIWENPKIKGD